MIKMKKITLTYYARKTVTLDVTKLDPDIQRKFALLEQGEYKMTDEEVYELDDFMYNLDRVVEDITGDDIIYEVNIDNFE